MNKETAAILAHVGVPEAQNGRADVIYGERGGYEIKVKTRHSNDTLAFYHAQGWINKKQYRAGDKLRMIAKNAGIDPLRAIEYADKVSGVKGEISDWRADNRKTYFEAMQYIGNHIWEKAAGDVCARGMWLKELTYLPVRNRVEKFAENSLNALHEFFELRKREARASISS